MIKFSRVLPGMLFAASLAASSIVAANAQTTTTFTDGAFAIANWQTALYHDGASTSSAFQVTSGGDPGAFRRIVNSDANDNMNAYSFLTSATISPSTGAITSISGSFDTQLEGPWGQGVSLALVQGGVDYEVNENTDYPTSWEHISETNLTAADFHVINNTSLHPDFSVSGAPITFGFVDGNSAGYGFRTTTEDFDNYSVTITQNAVGSAVAPEPGSIALLGLGGLPLGLGLLRRRCQARPATA